MDKIQQIAGEFIPMMSRFPLRSIRQLAVYSAHLVFLNSFPLPFPAGEGMKISDVDVRQDYSQKSTCASKPTHHPLPFQQALQTTALWAPRLFPTGHFRNAAT